MRMPDPNWGQRASVQEGTEIRRRQKAKCESGKRQTPQLAARRCGEKEKLDPACEKPKIRWVTTRYPLARRRSQRGDANGEKREGA